jgi:hypothetical protein
MLSVHEGKALMNFRFEMELNDGKPIVAGRKNDRNRCIKDYVDPEPRGDAAIALEHDLQVRELSFPVVGQTDQNVHLPPPMRFIFRFERMDR